MTANTKDRKIIGGILLIYLIFQIAAEILRFIRWEDDSTSIWSILYIRFVPLLLLTVSFFITDERIHNIATAVSFFAACIFEIIVIIDMRRSIPVAAIFYLVVYGLIGCCFVSHNESKKICVALTLIIAAAVLCYDCIYPEISSLLLRNVTKIGNAATNYKIYSTFSSFARYSVFSFVELMAVALDAQRKRFASDKTEQGILIKEDVIDFKDLLQFIESEYKSGSITEEAYKTKRAEILSKL